MGLDMMVRATKIKPARPVDFLGDDPSPEATGDTLWQWRKHPNLHGWMHRLYAEKGGGASSPENMGGFNAGNEVELTLNDLNRLEREIADASFYEPGKVTGFFFGESRIEDRDDDREFIRLARAAIARGEHLYYTSWW